jgi:imidazole glycerol-phosphate synthase subunit HisF
VKKKRLIPVVLLRGGWIVQSKEFKHYRNLGNPTTSVKRLSEWCSDEMIYLDITPNDTYDMHRDDIKSSNRNNLLDIIEDVSEVAFMPCAFGGGIRSLEHIRERLSRGADKVTVNTSALQDPSFVSKAAREFGSQCIVVSMDVKKLDEKNVVMMGGHTPTEYEAAEWARIVQDHGAGELLVNSVDRDGMKNGFDIQLLQQVCDVASVPVIACGGAGEWEHFAEAFRETGVDAVAAANIFQHVDQSVYLAKKFLFERSLPVRAPELTVFGA